MTNTRAPSSRGLRRKMVDDLEASGAIGSAAVRRAFLAEPRERYVPEIAERDGLEAIYRPGAALVTATDRRGLPISSSSAPGVMAPMLEALDLHPGLRVLEVGTGTGYNAALLSRLVGQRGHVTSVELDPDIARKARRILKTNRHPVTVVTGDARLGWAARAPFDRIIVTASSDSIPRSWRDQLNDGGLVVFPFRFPGLVTQAIFSLRREAAILRSTRIIPGGFMALRSSGETEAPIVPKASLNSFVISRGERSNLVLLSGLPINSLSENQRRALLRAVLSQVRRLNTMSGPRALGLLMFLQLHPKSQTIQCALGKRFGGGLVGPRGQGFAAVTYAFGQRGRIEAWGERAAEEALMALVEEWQGIGRPTLDRFSMTASYDRAASKSDAVWRQLDVGEASVRLSWSHP
ncbi:MAG: methyltransferase domain-containing protein [Nitrososphaerales archaeon]